MLYIYVCVRCDSGDRIKQSEYTVKDCLYYNIHYLVAHNIIGTIIIDVVPHYGLNAIITGATARLIASTARRAIYNTTRMML
jgi:hypothetical protein